MKQLMLFKVGSKSYLSAAPQVAEQVFVLQLFSDCNQRGPQGDDTQQLWQERMGSELG